MGGGFGKALAEHTVVQITGKSFYIELDIGGEFIRNEIFFPIKIVSFGDKKDELIETHNSKFYARDLIGYETFMGACANIQFFENPDDYKRTHIGDEVWVKEWVNEWDVRRTPTHLEPPDWDIRQCLVKCVSFDFDQMEEGGALCFGEVLDPDDSFHKKGDIIEFRIT